MADDRFDVVRKLFEGALEAPSEEREAFLENACGGDRGLYDEVASLLEADAAANSFLGQPAMSGGGEASWIGRTIGHYHIVGVIAAGGMGVVYRAEQEHPHRQVALKLIRGEMVAEQALRRFQLEAEVLGRLDHPGIARIYEAATADSELGRQPFFVMELIDGEPLTSYAAARSLALDARVELLIKVCEAVHHAHTNGVIHRDLKPANILVRDDGQPKVLDFGVARITDCDLQATTMHTDLGQLIGTLPYMSPEQVRGRHDELDLRSDVYALGVIGYELLTGRLPHELAGKTVSEAVRIIEFDEPSTLGAAGTTFSSDLETIIGACLEKERERRYSSAADLAADLRRFLEHRPIAARPPSAMYQLTRFARRNRALVTGAALAIAALVTGLAISVAGWRSATVAREQAELEAARANMLSSFLTDVLQAPDPWVDGREVKVIDVLAGAAARLDQALAAQPEVAALAHHRLGVTYLDLGQYDEAATHLGQALNISQATDGFPVAARVQILNDLGRLRCDAGELEDADRLSKEALATAVAKLGPGDPAWIKALHERGLVLWELGRLEEAEGLLRESLERSRSALGEEHEETMTTVAALGNVLRQLERRDEARPLLEAAFDYSTRQYGDDHPKTLITLNNLAFVYQELEDHERALPMFERSLEARRRVHGNDSSSVVIGLANLGLQLGLMGRGEEALPYLEEALASVDRVFGEGHHFGPAIRSTYGATLLRMGRLGDAERELVASVDGLAATLGGDHWRTKKACAHLAELYRKTGDEVRAAELQSRAE